MPKPYVPTGRPPGRPPRAPKPAVEELGIRDVVELLKETTCDRRFRPMNSLCPDCFPEGWGAYLALNCQHGTWVKR